VKEEDPLRIGQISETDKMADFMIMKVECETVVVKVECVDTEDPLNITFKSETDAKVENKDEEVPFMITFNSETDMKEEYKEEEDPLMISPNCEPGENSTSQSKKTKYQCYGFDFVAECPSRITEIHCTKE